MSESNFRLKMIIESLFLTSSDKLFHFVSRKKHKENVAVVSQVNCGAGLYRFLIFDFFFTLKLPVHFTSYHSISYRHSSRPFKFYLVYWLFQAQYDTRRGSLTSSYRFATSYMYLERSYSASNNFIQLLLRSPSVVVSMPS